MTPPNYTVDLDRRWSTIKHGTARAREIDHRLNRPAKSSRDRSDRRVTSPQPHPERPLRSPKSGYASLAIIAVPVKSP